MVIRALYDQADLSQAEFDKVFHFDQACKLVTVFVHSDQEITEDIVISLDSERGADFDTVIRRRTLAGESDYVFAAQGDIALNEADKIRVQISNANLFGNVYVGVKAEV